MYAGCHEPNLGELLRDPLIRQLMASDGITERTICKLIGKVRRDRSPTKDNNGIDAVALCGRAAASNIEARDGDGAT